MSVDVLTIVRRSGREVVLTLVGKHSICTPVGYGRWLAKLIVLAKRMAGAVSTAL